MRYFQIVENSNIKISAEMLGHHHGQSDMQLNATLDKTTVGYITFSVYRGEIMIHFIQSYKERSGIGSAMVRHLQSLYPNTEIEWGGTTDSGESLRKSLSYKTIIDDDLQKKFDQLASVKSSLKKLALEYHLADDQKRLSEISERMNELHDIQYSLEQELHGQSPHRNIVEF